MACHVYIIKQIHTNHIKVGKSKDIQSRMRAMQSGNPFALELIHSFACATERRAFSLEARIHRVIKTHKTKYGGGSEWFEYPALGTLARMARDSYNSTIEKHSDDDKEVSRSILNIRLVEFYLAMGADKINKYSEIKSKNRRIKEKVKARKLREERELERLEPDNNWWAMRDRL